MSVVADVTTDDPRHHAAAKKIQNTLIRDCGLELDSLIARITDVPDRKVKVRKVVGTGKDYIEVISRAVRDDFDLIVKSTNPHNALHEAVFGSTNLRLMHHSPKPVLILKPLRRKRWRAVLVAVDPMAESREALQLNSDLLVMGSVARSGIPGLVVGNTAEKILGHVDCSVLVLKPKGFKTG